MKLKYEDYENTARRAVSEGVVLLKNKDNVLPIKKDARVALFGRIQSHYYKSGTGSGGMVNAGKVWTFPEAFKRENIKLNEELKALYEEFDKTHPYDMGAGFGSEPWSQEEMELDKAVAKKAAGESDIAIVIIGRTAGEEQDYRNEPGAYKISETEKNMLMTVREAFDKMVVIMNVSAVLDMEDVEKAQPDAILYAWQGGQVGALGTVDVIVGNVSPSGKLTDTIAKKIEDTPAFPNFGRIDYNCYAEDIYVGYKWYSTFNKKAVLYPFGFGLSYTSFRVDPKECLIRDHMGKIISMEDLIFANKTIAEKGAVIEVSFVVENTGNYPGKEVVEVYLKAPQGKLGKPAISLAGFTKTKELKPGEKALATVKIDPYLISSYDDLGVTGHEYCYVLEEGEYEFLSGDCSDNLKKAGGFTLAETLVTEKLSQQMAPIKAFRRVRPRQDNTVEEGFKPEYEEVPLAKVKDIDVAKNDNPKCEAYNGDKGIKLIDVKNGKATMDEFIAQLSDEDLAAIVRGEGMGSPKVTAGTAAAFGGVSPALKNFGIPCGCCSDGPSGMRMDCGTRAFSLPNGTLLACTWNTELNEKLFGMLGIEMTKNKIDVLLGPGINIHRHPLNGRNFEYFSEDPLMTGRMAAAQFRGLKSAGVSGTLKHFCGNNQETHRHDIDSVISERALREVYLKGFEIAIKEGGADSVMTTYGAVNGSWTNSRHDLCTCILREEWGFKGIVMTDWWAKIGDVDGKISRNDFARCVLAQNDFYAVCPDAAVNSSDDNLLSELASGGITRGQMARCAANICAFLENTHAFERINGKEPKLELEGFDDAEGGIDAANVEYFDIEDGTVIDLSNVLSVQGCLYAFGLNVKKPGCYKMVITGKSDLSELAQIPIGIFFQSIPSGTFTFNGTGGEYKSLERKVLLSNKYGVMRFYFGGNGLKLKDLKFIYEKDYDPALGWDGYADYIKG
ncbi:MAG: glycoside hydrolase family 3 C-terminal domain-containing protein [Lachnospiraceae bacterium]|nr:glycoside hydrolase family 3 C-terminal domain-containing protein [Lachnospiraceae bacterium]